MWPFEYFGGAPHEVLVDNERTQVLSHTARGKARSHPSFLALADHYGFIPRACRPHRARTKGKDERAVGHLKRHFFVRHRAFESFAHLNKQAERWLGAEADRRRHGTTREVVIERFAREVPHLHPLPPTRFDTSYRETRWVAWDGYIGVRGNRYSVPTHLCGHRLIVRIGLDEIPFGCSPGTPKNWWPPTDCAPPPGDGGRIPDHHRALWQEALRVEQRDLSVYEEAARCN